MVGSAKYYYYRIFSVFQLFSMILIYFSVLKNSVDLNKLKKKIQQLSDDFEEIFDDLS